MQTEKTELLVDSKEELTLQQIREILRIDDKEDIISAVKAERIMADSLIKIAHN